VCGFVSGRFEYQTARQALPAECLVDRGNHSGFFSDTFFTENLFMNSRFLAFGVVLLAIAGLAYGAGLTNPQTTASCADICGDCAATCCAVGAPCCTGGEPCCDAADCCCLTGEDCCDVGAAKVASGEQAGAVASCCAAKKACCIVDAAAKK